MKPSYTNYVATVFRYYSKVYSISLPENRNTFALLCAYRSSPSCHSILSSFFSKSTISLLLMNLFRAREAYIFFMNQSFTLINVVI